MLQILTFIFVSTVVATSAAANSKIDDVSNAYQKSPMIIMDVKKTVHADLLGKDKIIEGKMTTGKGLFRWESEQPDKVLIVFDGKYLWNVQYPSPDFGGSTQATKSEISERNKSQILPALILSNEPISKHFAVVNETKEKNLTVFDLKAKSKDFVVQNIKMKVETAKNKIVEISFKDEAGSTTFEFLKTDIQNKFSQAPFTYKPGPDVKVTDI
jgi:outer membrane lipoprotein-sorting protein